MPSLSPALPLVVRSHRRTREIRTVVLTLVLLNLVLAACLVGLLFLDHSITLGAVVCTSTAVLIISVGVPLLVFPLTRGPAQTLCLTHDTLLITERGRVQTIPLAEVAALSTMEVSPPARYLEAQYALQLWNAEQQELARITLNAFELPHLRRVLDALRLSCPLVTIDPQVWHLLTPGDDGGTT